MMLLLPVLLRFQSSQPRTCHAEGNVLHDLISCGLASIAVELTSIFLLSFLDVALGGCSGVIPVLLEMFPYLLFDGLQ